MATRKEIGNKGEENAVSFLFANGYEVLERNYRFGRGEIDIIALKNSVMVFIEVKTRSRTDYGYPEQTLSPGQAQKIIEAAQEYIRASQWEGLIRFDIVAITINTREVEIQLFRDAFY